MNNIAVVLPVRKNSERVTEKMLRPFAGRSLFHICLEKLAWLKEQGKSVFVAAYDEEFKRAARDMGVSVIDRSEASANSEDDPEAYEFLNDINHEWICLVSACVPMLDKGTMLEFMEFFEYLTSSGRPGSGVVAVTDLRRYIWDQREDLSMVNLNPGDGNSKRMHCLFPCANALYGFSRKTYLGEPYKYWPGQQPIPHIIDDVEAFDIDTKKQFGAAEAIYRELVL